MTDEAPVLVAIDDGLAVITLNRPAQLNALTQEMSELLEQTFADIGANPDVRVVVIAGAGKGFCAGADMGRLQGLVADKGAGLATRRPEDPNPIYDGLDAPDYLRSRLLVPMAMPQPVIAAINGACAGVGLAIAVACDIRFGSPQALFTAAFPRRGLTAEAGLAWSLPRIVGRAAASDMMLSGRRIGAAEAERMGLLNAIVEDDVLAHTLAYARDIAANCSPRSTRTIKRQLRLAADQDQREAVILAHDEVVASLACEDFQEGVASFVEKRPPQFTGR
ncbi:MAG: enoyl-CoA hydratase/isomerase [Caulobacter sp.]|nr:enoyl-CoA hydratase/isomerase [Caulobacter sp.]